jgi:glutathione S-transferase
MESGPYRVYGLNQSFFTRKLTGYFDYKGIPWVLRRFGGMNPTVTAAGWPGGIPAVQNPDGVFMWDSTAVIHHLELLFPERGVLPPDPVQRFLCYVIEDVADEWLYRAAVGSRWFFAENGSVGGYELAREISPEIPAPCDQVFAMVRAHMTRSCPPMGVTEETIGAWIDEVLKPWLRVLGAHVEQRPFLFGERPSLADFAVFGGNAAHLLNDPLCRRWTEAEGPAVVKHTHRLLEPEPDTFGNWANPTELPETLIALLADLGRLYLPWVSRATVHGAADLVFKQGSRISVRATDFLVEARGILLARYAQHRCQALDAVLQRAGILPYFADFFAHATRVPDYTAPPRPHLNRPFPADLP